MDDSVLAILGFVAACILLAVAALRFGVDSRGLTRESPLPGDPVVRIAPDFGRHGRELLTLEAFREHARMRTAWRVASGAWEPLRHSPGLKDSWA
jgi:hypothetical protein